MDDDGRKPGWVGAKNSIANILVSAAIIIGVLVVLYALGFHGSDYCVREGVAACKP